MREAARAVIPAKNIRSLAFLGDELVDPAGGFARYRLDGAYTPPALDLKDEFDAAALSEDGVYAVAYRRLGTRAILFKNGAPLRELSRPAFKAAEYEYPVTLLTTRRGQRLLAHCPDDPGRLELEDAETGRRLTARKTPLCRFYHSRLKASPDGRYLISAGWVWRPWDALCVFDVDEALKRPAVLDQYGSVDERDEHNLAGWGDEDVGSAAFSGSDHLVLANAEERPDEDAEAGFRLHPNRIGLYSLSARRLVSVASLDEVAGTLMPVGEHAVGFYEYPKLIEIASGDVVHRWEELKSGRQSSSLIHYVGKIPPLALDPAKTRFAVASGEAITVIQLKPKAKAFSV
jgi:hypothetical protein